MYQVDHLTDTIAAIATANTGGGIGIIRLSGDNAVSIVDKVFKAKNKRALHEQTSHMMNYGWIIHHQQTQEEIVDEVLVVLMRAPRSYTTQDVVEIHCHGGVVVVRKILSLCLSHGARLASPGEFTKRAFINGRIDLAQAESVLDIIQAKTEDFLRISQHQLSGELSAYLVRMRESLMRIYTVIEAVINFPEDDISVQIKEDITTTLTQVARDVGQLLNSANQGRLYKEGIRIVLCGKPNVGKSSLLNALLKQQRAIVTDIAGTTRDVIEETANIHGIPFVLADTAGILEPRDLVELEAIKRSHLFIDSADMVLLVIDTSRKLEEGDWILFEKLKSRPVIVVANKSDLPSCVNMADIPFKHIVSLSAMTKDNLSALEDKMASLIMGDAQGDSHGLMITNVRHQQALQRAADHLSSALVLVKQQGAWEVINDDIKHGINHLDAITGRNIDVDLIDAIFNQFCIGK